MAMFIRAKRVTEPLDEKAKARLRGEDHSSSGSEHEPAVDPSFFPDLVHDFLNSSTAFVSFPAAAGDKDGCSDDDDDGFAHVADVVRDLLDSKGDPIRIRILAETERALVGLRASGSEYRREVMARLRDGGHNAGVCKARWASSDNLTAGSHEYIDLLEETTRYIVDVDFASEFELARATPEYEKVVAALPRVMVGREEEMRQVVRTMAGAARRSLRRQSLSVPPWRKSRYMLAKWLGPYRRTINPFPSSVGSNEYKWRRCQMPVSRVLDGCGSCSTTRSGDRISLSLVEMCL